MNTSISFLHSFGGRVLSHAAFFACAPIFMHGVQAADAGSTDAKTDAPPPINFHILQTQRVNLGDRSLIMNRVAPPVLPPLPPAKAPPIPTAEDLRAQETKKSLVLFLSVTVYDREVSELRWTDEGGTHRAFSNIDFNWLAGMGGFETAEANYFVMLGLGNETREVANAQASKTAEQDGPARPPIPARAAFSDTRSEYAVADDEAKPSPEILAGLDALHIYFDAHRASLVEDSKKRTETLAAQEQWLKVHPPKPKDTVINYWIGNAGATREMQNAGGRP